MARIVIIGAGFAGVATARALAAGGAGEDVLVLEQDPAPGQRASGRNAGMIRTLLADPDLQALARESAAEIAGVEGAFWGTGGLILGSGAGLTALDAAAARGGSETITDPPLERIPWLEGVSFARGWWTAADGTVDPAALLHHYLLEARQGGVRVETGVEVIAVRVESGRAAGVSTSRGFEPAGVVVNAAGAFAGEFGGAADRIEIRPRRRHLFSTGPVGGAAPDLPYVWHDTEGFYFRPESGGFLLSACDETPHPPGEPAVDPDARAGLAEKLVGRAPRLGDLPIRRVWACLRTFARDDRPVIGWDPLLPGLYWVAALGGHGVTVSAAAGRLAAREIAEGPAARNPFSPHRFTGEAPPVRRD